MLWPQFTYFIRLRKQFFILLFYERRRGAVTHFSQEQFFIIAFYEVPNIIMFIMNNTNAYCLRFFN